MPRKQKQLFLGSAILVLPVVVAVGYFLLIHQRLQAPKWALPEVSLSINGQERSFQYYLPDSVAANPALVFIMHGSGGSPWRMRYLSNYEFEKTAAQKKNVIIVYPEGTHHHWNDCRASASYRANRDQIAELPFFKQMIGYFYQNHRVDTTRVFAAGFSNGAHMALKLAYELPEAIKGIGMIAANIPEDANNDCHPKNIPRSVMLINGTKDPVNPYYGGLVVLDGDSSRGRVRSSENTIDYWKNILPCKPVFKESRLSAQVVKQSWRCTESRFQLQLITIEEGGHNIPLVHPPPYLPARLGNVNRQLNSPKLLLDFFEGL
jgi:polyhydroxybutyrate depolymerase